MPYLLLLDFKHKKLNDDPAGLVYLLFLLSEIEV